MAGGEDLAAALQELERLLAESPGDVRLLLKLGDMYARSGDVPNATRHYRTVAERLAGDGFYVKAIIVYKQVLKLDSAPACSEVRAVLAGLYEELGLDDEAEEIRRGGGG